MDEMNTSIVINTCKYKLIKNEITDHLEKEFHDQYWYLDCEKWGNAVVNFENGQWHASASNGCDIYAGDPDALCEETVSTLLDNLQDQAMVLKERIDKNTLELKRAKMRVELLPSCISNDLEDLNNIMNLIIKKTRTTKSEIMRQIKK